MSVNDTVTVGRVLPRLASVAPANGPFTVSVTWAKGNRVGRTDIVDLAPMIFTYKVFRPLRDDPVLFQSVKVGEWGSALEWDGGVLEIGAGSIEEMAEEVMTNSEFAEFLARNKLTLDAAAAQLGISRRLVAYYAKSREIPRLVALACRHLDTVLSTPAGRTDAAADAVAKAVGALEAVIGTPHHFAGGDQPLAMLAMGSGVVGIGDSNLWAHGSHITARNIKPDIAARTPESPGVHYYDYKGGSITAKSVMPSSYLDKIKL